MSILLHGVWFTMIMILPTYILARVVEAELIQGKVWITGMVIAAALSTFGWRYVVGDNVSMGFTYILGSLVVAAVTFGKTTVVPTVKEKTNDA